MSCLIDGAACMAGDLDCCVDILIHVAQRLRDSEDVPSEEVASAAKRVSDALTKEVGCSRRRLYCIWCLDLCTAVRTLCAC